MKKDKALRIAITGYSGYIGPYLLNALIRFYKLQNKDVVFDLYDLKDGFNVADLDCKFIKPDEVDVVYHLAAQADVQESIKDPIKDALYNIMGSIRVLQSFPNSKIVVASSAGAATEKPDSPYGVSKLASEHYANILHKNAVVCRLPNVFGKGGRGVIDIFLKEKKSVKINGDGLQTRDYVHVEDIVNGLMKASEWESGVYELGSEKSYSVYEIAVATGKKIKFQKAKGGEVLHSICKNTTPNWKSAVDPIWFIKNNK